MTLDQEKEGCRENEPWHIIQREKAKRRKEHPMTHGQEIADLIEALILTRIEQSRMRNVNLGPDELKQALTRALDAFAESIAHEG